WLTEKGKDADLSEYWKKYQEYKKKSAEEKKKGDAAAKAAEALKALGYDPDLRWERERKDPLVRCDLVEIKNLALKMTDKAAKTGGGVPSLTSVSADVAQLSTMPGWNAQPITMTDTGTLNDGKSGKISFKIRYLPAKSDVEFKLEGVSVTEMKNTYEKSVPVNVDNGLASVSTKAGTDAGMI